MSSSHLNYLDNSILIDCINRPTCETPFVLAIIGPPEMAFRWRADDSPLSCIMACLRNIGTGPPLTKLSRSAPHMYNVALLALDKTSNEHARFFNAEFTLDHGV